jgi:hypothetical protein
MRLKPSRSRCLTTLGDFIANRVVWLTPKIGPKVQFHVEQLYFDALRALSMKDGMSVSEYLRDNVVEPFLQAKTREEDTVRQSAGTSVQFIRHVKEYLDLATGIPIAGDTGLPSDGRRDDLEAVVWKALQDLADFVKTEEAAKNAKARTHSMEVMAAMATAHLAILKYQDKAAVGVLLDRVKAGLRELEKSTGKSSGTT